MLQAIVHQGVRAALLNVRPAQLSIPEMTKPPKADRLGVPSCGAACSGSCQKRKGADRRLPRRGTLASAYQGRPDEGPASTGCMRAENSERKR